MNAAEALKAGHNRALVTDGSVVGVISELVGPSWFGRGEDSAIVEISLGRYRTVPLERLRLAEQVDPSIWKWPPR